MAQDFRLAAGGLALDGIVGQQLDEMAIGHHQIE